MSRVGLPACPSTSAALWLPFRDGSLSDLSGAGMTVTATGSSGTLPTWAPGPFGDALQFGTNAASPTYPRLEVANHATINWTGAFSVECYFRTEEGANRRPLLARRAQNGGQLHAWELSAHASMVRFTIYNAAQLSDYLENFQAFPGASTASSGTVYATRWMHVCAVYDGSAMYIYVDGALLAQKTTSIADINAASLGPIQIGAETSTVLTSQFTGRIAEVLIHSAAYTDVSGIGPNLTPERISRRQWHVHELDLRQQLQAETWTNDGAGGFWLAKADIPGGSFIVTPNDIQSVKANTVATTTLTTYTEVGNVTDLDAASNSWFWDAVNSRLYVSENPTGLTTLEVIIRTRLADKDVIRGFNFYPAAIIEQQAAERAMPYWDRDYPTGGGGSLKIAAQHPDLPDGFASEEATSILWTNARVKSYALSDGLYWCQAVPQFAGVIDTQPEDARDTIDVKLMHTPSQLHKVPMQVKRAAKGSTVNEDYPKLDPRADGYVWPTIFGEGLRRIPIKCIDTTEQTVGGITGLLKWKVCDHPITLISGPGTGNIKRTNAVMYSIDLSVGEFYVKKTDMAPDGDHWVDCSGWGTASDATSDAGVAYSSFGSTGDALDTPEEWLRKALDTFAANPSAIYGTTVAATGAVITTNRRCAEPMADEGGLVRFLRQLCAESLTFLYWKPSPITTTATTQTCEWEYIDTGEAAAWIIRDADIIAERFDGDRSTIAKVAQAQAYAYQSPPDSSLLTKGVGTSLKLRGETRYGITRTWVPGSGLLTYLSTASQVNSWLAAIRPFLENVTWFHHVTVGSRFAAIEQMDVVDDQSSGVPDAAGSRFRVLSVSPKPDGSIDLVLFSEANWTGSVAADTPDRESLIPVPVYRFGEFGLGGARAGTGAYVAIDRTLIQGGLPFAPNITHRFQMHGNRVGGGADTDAKLRLRDTTNSVTICEIGSISTSAGFQSSVTPANFPSGDALVELQYIGTNGANLVCNSASWEAQEEDGNEIGDPMSPCLLYASGSLAGSPCPNTSGEWIEAGLGIRSGQMSWADWPPGCTWRWCVHLTIPSGTLRVAVWEINNYGNEKILVDFGTNSSTGFYSTTFISPGTAMHPAFSIQYVSTGTSNTLINAISCYLINPVP